MRSPGSARDASAERRLAELLADADPNVRAAAADALGAVGARDAAALRWRRRWRPRARSCGSPRCTRSPGSRCRSRVASSRACSPTRCCGPPASRCSAASDDRGASTRCSRGSRRRLARGARGGDGGARAARGLAAPGEDQLLGERLRASVADAPILPDALAAARRGAAHHAARAGAVPRLAADAPDCVVPLLEAGRDEALSEVVLGALAGAGPGGRGERRRRLGDALGRRRAASLRAARAHAAARPATRCSRRARRHAIPRCAPPRRARSARARREGALPALVAALRGAATATSEAAALRSRRAGRARAGDPRCARRRGRGARRSRARRCSRWSSTERRRASGSPRRACSAGIGAPRHQQRVELLLSDPSAAVRRAAVDALARLGSDAQLEPLRCALADESPRCASAPRQRARRVRDPGAVVDDLARLLDDDEPRVVRARRCARSRAGRSRPAARRRASARCCCSPWVSPHGGPVGPRGARGAARDRRRGRSRPREDAARQLRARARARGGDRLLRRPRRTRRARGAAPAVSHADWTVRARGGPGAGGAPSRPGHPVDPAAARDGAGRLRARRDPARAGDAGEPVAMEAAAGARRSPTRVPHVPRAGSRSTAGSRSRPSRASCSSSAWRARMRELARSRSLAAYHYQLRSESRRRRRARAR